MLQWQESEVNMDEQRSTDTNIFHNFKDKSATFSIGAIIFLVIVLGIGIGTGYLLSKHNVASVNGLSTNNTSAGGIVKGAIYGSSDTSTFKDTATGVLQTGGIDGEGQFHLVRPGGDSQSVYMTSSVIDLSQFVGHKVQVWGQTQAAQHAGWLMDVGRLEVVQ